MKKVYFFVVAAAFLFSTMEVALKLAGNHLDPFQLTFLRFMAGGLLLLPFAVKEMRYRHLKITIKDLGYLLYVGILGIPISMVLFQMGVMHSNASTASVLICMNPFFVMVFAHFMTDEKMNKSKAIALSCSFLGILFMIRPWEIQVGNTVLGVVFVLLASLFFGWYTVAGKISIQKIGIMAQTSISSILGALVLLVVILVMGRPVTAGVLDNWMIVSYVSVFVTGLGYLCYFTAIKLSDATTGSIAFFLKPAMAPVMAVIFLGETILWNTYVGIGLILLASYLNIRGAKKGRENV